MLLKEIRLDTDPATNALQTIGVNMRGPNFGSSEDEHIITKVDADHFDFIEKYVVNPDDVRPSTNEINAIAKDDAGKQSLLESLKTVHGLTKQLEKRFETNIKSYDEIEEAVQAGGKEDVTSFIRYLDKKHKTYLSDKAYIDEIKRRLAGRRRAFMKAITDKTATAGFASECADGILQIAKADKKNAAGLAGEAYEKAFAKTRLELTYFILLLAQLADKAKLIIELIR